MDAAVGLPKRAAEAGQRVWRHRRDVAPAAPLLLAPVLLDVPIFDLSIFNQNYLF